MEFSLSDWRDLKHQISDMQRSRNTCKIRNTQAIRKYQLSLNLYCTWFVEPKTRCQRHLYWDTALPGTPIAKPKIKILPIDRGQHLCVSLWQCSLQQHNFFWHYNGNPQKCHVSTECLWWYHCSNVSIEIKQPWLPFAQRLMMSQRSLRKQGYYCRGLPCSIAHTFLVCKVHQKPCSQIHNLLGHSPW